MLLSWCSGVGIARPIQPSAPAAVGALGELSPGGALMRHHHTHSLARKKSDIVYKNIQMGSLQ